MSALSILSEDVDFEQAWAEIISRCNSITDWNLNSGDRSITINQVLSRINPPKERKHSTRKDAAAVFKKALVCVDRFGSIVAQAASNVFPASQQCFNAISFVISAVQQYDQVFDDITALMERVSVFLEKLQIYIDDRDTDTTIDKRLRLTVYRVLEHFLLIMGKAHKLTQGWKSKMKLMVKIGAFGEDEGIKDAMARLETLVSDVIRQEISVIVSGMSAAAKDIRGVDAKADVLVGLSQRTLSGIDRLTSAEEKRAIESQETRDLEIARKAFTDGEIDDSPEKWQRECWSLRVPGTGEWLLSQPAPFGRWSDSGVASLHILPLSGPSGYGKSFLSCIVIEHLQVKHKDCDDVGVAFYCGSKRNSSEKNVSLKPAIMSIIWQLASMNLKGYLKAVAKACHQQRPDFSDLSKVWRRFVMDIVRESDLTLYVVLDGIDNFDEDGMKHLRDIVREIGPSQSASTAKGVRLLLTGTPETIESLTSGQSVSSGLDLNPPMVFSNVTTKPLLNEADLRLFVQHRLGRMNLINRPEHADLREEIETKVLAGVRGDYLALNHTLNEISNASMVQDVTTILKRAGETRGQQIERDINRLNETLSQSQITAINRLFPWIANRRGRFTVECGESVLNMNEETSFLTSLETEIKTTYSALLTVRNNEIEFKTDDVSGCIWRSGYHRLGKGRFEKMEVDLVRRALKTHLTNVFGGDDIYQRYGLDSYLDSKLEEEEVRLHLDLDTARVEVILGCLTVLCEQYADSNFDALYEYAANFIRSCFNDEYSLQTDEVDIKQEIGRKLFSLVTERDIIDGFFSHKKVVNEYLEENFHLSLTKNVHDWFKDKDVQQGMRGIRGAQRWITDVTSEGTPAVSIYNKIAEKMVERWCEGDDNRRIGHGLPEMLQAFRWLRVYVLQYSGEAMVDFRMYDYADVPVGDVRRVEDLARKQLSEKTDEVAWNVLLGDTMSATFHHSEAIECYSKALEDRPDNWRIRYHLAKAHASDGRYLEAVQAIEGCIAKKDALLATDEEYTEAYWEFILPHTADWKLELKDLLAAEKAYRNILDRGLKLETFGDHLGQVIFKLSGALYGMSRFDEITTIFNKLREVRNPDSVTWLTRLVQTFAFNDNFHAHLHALAKPTNMYQLISDYYEHVIAETRQEDDDSEDALYLQRYHELLKWRYGPREDRDAILTSWETVVYGNFKSNSDRYWGVFGEYRRSLASALLDQAKAAGLRLPWNPNAKRYIDRLELLLETDNVEQVISYAHTQLLLARAYHLAGDNSRARSILRGYVEEWFGRLEWFDGSWIFEKLSDALRVLDDDLNAIAAFNMMGYLDDAETSGDGKNQAQEEDSTGEPVPFATTEGESPADEAAIASTNSQEDVDTKNPDLIALSLIRRGRCDGACADVSPGFEAIYVCKDCLDTFFCPNCYEKLKADTLDLCICSAEHAHMRVPCMEMARFKSATKDKMWVGDELVNCEDWLAMIKTMWLSEENITVFTAIQKAWRRRRSGKQKETDGDETELNKDSTLTTTTST